MEALFIVVPKAVVVVVDVVSLAAVGNSVVAEVSVPVAELHRVSSGQGEGTNLQIGRSCTLHRKIIGREVIQGGAGGLAAGLG